MRLDKENLLNLTRDFVAERTRSDYRILAVFLCGALLGEEYLLGGTADIDLIFIHIIDVPFKREVVRLADEVHLDIAHHTQEEYSRPHQLRSHPWLGPTLFECKPLHDPRHFIDFTQAGVRGQFDRPDYVLARARSQAEHARQIWSSLTLASTEPGPKELEIYLRSVNHAANAIALLSGPPLTERRFLIGFPRKAEAVGRPGLFPGLLGLLGGPNVEVDDLRLWFPSWQETLAALPQSECPPTLHPDRRLYYLRAFEAILEMEEPRAVLWPLLSTWTQAALVLPADAPQQEAWRSAFQYLGLAGAGFGERLAALDAYLDLVEETLADWAKQTGA
jgi:hypothetical protein